LAAQLATQLAAGLAAKTTTDLLELNDGPIPRLLQRSLAIGLERARVQGQNWRATAHLFSNPLPVALFI
jgi:hypothetical protein